MAQYGFGSGQMFGTRTDIVGATPLLFGTMQDVSIDFNGEIKELFGQFQYPVDTARGKTKIQGKTKFASIAATAYNNIFFGQAQTTGQTLVASETDVVPGTPFHVTVVNSVTFVADLGVINGTTGLPMTQVASSPATGEYSVAAGVYTFAAADTGISMSISYSYTVTTGATVTITNALMGTTPKWKGVFTMTYEGKSLTMILNQCTSAKLTIATKIDDYTIPEMDFSAFADASGTVGSLTAAA